MTEEMPVPRGAVRCTEYHLAIPADKPTADFLPALQERTTTSQFLVLYLKDAFSRGDWQWHFFETVVGVNITALLILDINIR